MENEPHNKQINPLLLPPEEPEYGEIESRPLPPIRDLDIPLSQKRLLYFLENDLGEIERKWEDQGKDPYYEQQRRVREEAKQYQGADYEKIVRERYPEAFETRQRLYPPKWFTEMKTGLESTRSMRVFDILCALWKFVWDHSWKTRASGHHDQCNRFARKNGLPEDLIWFDPRIDLIKSAARKLGQSKDNIELYRVKMIRCGILKKFREKGSHSSVAYAPGYWLKWKGRFIAEPYLAEKLFDAIVEEFGFVELRRKKRKQRHLNES